jgi:D-aminoacyl-tRNA deacylase
MQKPPTFDVGGFSASALFDKETAGGVLYVKAVIQRVLKASVVIDGETVAAIQHGILLFLGVDRGDSEKDASWLAEKITHLRIFEDGAGKMNLSVLDAEGSILAVSQFTLSGNCTKGRRPSFDRAEEPLRAKQLYDYFIRETKRLGVSVTTGVFQANMSVSLINDGPVTFILESQNRT